MTRKRFLAVRAICLVFAGCNGADSTSDPVAEDSGVLTDAAGDADSASSEASGPDAPDSSLPEASVSDVTDSATFEDAGSDASDSSLPEASVSDVTDSATFEDAGSDAPDSNPPEEDAQADGNDADANDTSLDVSADAPADSDQSDAVSPAPAWLAQLPIDAQSLALTSDGGVLIGGAGGGTKDILGEQVDLSTDWRAVVLKLNPDGSKAWLWTSPPGGQLAAIGSSPTNEVCVLTQVASTPGTGTPLHFYKLSSDGTQTWHGTSPSSLSAQIHGGAAVPTAEGDCIFTGSFRGSLFGVNALAQTAFVLRDGPVPGKYWTWLMPNSGSEVSALNAVRLGADGTVLAGGILNPGVPSALVVALDSAGAYKWSRQAGQSVYMGINYVADLAVGPDRLWFGGAVGMDALEAKMFLGAFDFTGSPLGYQLASSIEGNRISGVTIDSKEHVWITGQHRSAFSFGGSTLLSASGIGMFIAELDKSGTLLSSRSVSAELPDVINGSIAVIGNRIAVQPSGRVIVLGSRTTEVDFGPDVKVFGTGGTFVLSYSP